MRKTARLLKTHRPSRPTLVFEQKVEDSKIHTGDLVTIPNRGQGYIDPMSASTSKTKHMMNCYKKRDRPTLLNENCCQCHKCDKKKESHWLAAETIEI